MEAVKPEDTRLMELFRTGILPTSEFTHENHIRVAWTELQTYGIDEGSRLFIIDLLNYVESKNAIAKYSDQITRAWLKIIAERIRNEENWEQFKVSNTDLFTNAKDVLHSVISSAARNPDLSARKPE